MRTGIGDVFAPTLAHDPHREALITPQGRWTYRDLDDSCARAAAALAAHGVRPGDRVAAALPNGADIVVAFHGAMRLGAIWVGINQALAPPEMHYQLADAGAVLLLCDAPTAQALATSAAGLPRTCRLIELDDWRTAVHSVAPAHDLTPPDLHAPAALAYTSGTTGRPKAVVHSQYNLLLPGAVLVRSRGYGPDLRKGDCLPLTIVNLLALSTLLTAQCGGTCVVLDTLRAPAVAAWIAREQVTVWNGPPPILHDLVRDDTVAPASLASLREAWSGGSDLPDVLRERFAAKFAVAVIATYGLSEAPTIVSIDPPDGSHVPGASGRPLPHLTIRTAPIDATNRDTDTDTDTDGDGDGDGDGSGEVCVAPVRSGAYTNWYRPMLGYWNRPQETATALAGGVLHTGDVGHLDADGWLHIRDRQRLVIVRGGANVYPAEVERVLHTLPGVAAAAVTAIPDERLGHRVAAALQPEPGALLSPPEIREQCATQLARYKIPERIVLVDGLPRNAMGKVDRTALDALVRDRLAPPHT